jgi:cation:H+ antiporter
VVAALAFCVAYGVYVRRTLAHGGEVQAEDTLGPLILDRGRDWGRPPAMRLILLQLAIGLGAIVGGAHLFVEELIEVAESLGIEPLILSLILAPLATELPEKANSFFWIREGKDSLALGNITGAMVFQSTLPVAFGLAFTSWDLDAFAILSVCLGLAGGLVAYWVLRLRGRFNALAIVLWGALYSAFLGAVIIS